MTRHIINMKICRILASVVVVGIHAQTQPPAQFEVASIRLTNPDDFRSASGIATGKGRLSAHNVTLKRCIIGAYAVGPNQIFGGPVWLDSERFDIEAKTVGRLDDDAAFMAMLRLLLADRFKLALHRETRLIPAYVLEVGKNGPKLEKAADGEAITDSGRGRLYAQVITMRHFAEVLSRHMDSPV